MLVDFHSKPTEKSNGQKELKSKRDAIALPDPLPVLVAQARALGLEVLAVSAVTGAGLPELKHRLFAMVTQARTLEPVEERA